MPPARRLKRHQGPLGRSAALWRRLKPVGAGADRAVAAAGLLAGGDDAALDLADPDALAVGEYMVDFAVGGIYDDAYRRHSAHASAGLDEPRLWRLRAGGPVRPADRHDDRPHADGAHAARSLPAGDAADPGDGVAAAVDDPVRARRQVGVRAGLPRRLLSDPAQHDLRRALGRSEAVRGGSMLGCSRQRAVLQGRAAGRRCRRSSPACGSASASPGS